MVKGVLFDFNGTLVFDDPVNEASWRSFLLQKTDRRIEEAEFQKFINGRNAQFSMRYFLGDGLTDADCRLLEEEKEKIYREMSVDVGLKLAPGAESFLTELKDRHIPITIGTAAGLSNVRFFFEYYRLGQWFSFDQVVYNNGHINGKPAPDIYLHAADRIHIPIGSCAVFEDSESGLEAGRRSGASRVIRVDPCWRGPVNDTSVSAVITDYSDLSELKRILEG